GLQVSQVLESLIRSLTSYCMVFDVPYQDAPFSLLQDAEIGNLQRTGLGTTISVSCDGGFESYWSARPRDLRQNVRRYLKRAEQEQGAVRFVVHKRPDEIASAVERFGVLESAGWKGAKGTALHPDNEQGRF